MKIAIVILNWNGKELLEQFLPSVVKYSTGATIYLADNASTDDSITFVSSSYPSVKILRNDENSGYAKGYNEALKHVDADIYCLLNSDVEVTENWLVPIEKIFKDETKVAIVQPKICDFKNKSYFEYAGAAGGFIDKFGYPYCRGRVFDTIEKDHGQYNDTIPIFWASGACLFIRRKVFNALNGFDTSFFAHMEEIDLCWRAKSMGYDAVFVGTSKVYHVGGATLSNSSPKKTFLNFRNSLFALVKNARGQVLFLVLARLALDGVAGVKFLAELKFNHFFAIIKAHIDFYKHLPTLLKKRNSIKNKTKYYQRTSIVWDYFVNNKKFYKSS